ncbi:MAG: hypothetical protein LQ341_007095, partial [Variospora aurantia]
MDDELRGRSQPKSHIVWRPGLSIGEMAMANSQARGGHSESRSIPSLQPDADGLCKFDFTQTITYRVDPPRATHRRFDDSDRVDLNLEEWGRCISVPGRTSPSRTLVRIVNYYREGMGPAEMKYEYAMPSLEIPTPPSKRRRIAPNHGSQGVFSRALQVVKDAVPASLISLPNPVLDAPIIPTAISDQHGDAPLPPTSIDSCEGSVSTEDQLHGVNGFGSNGAEDANNHARPMPDQSTERRTSKRLRAPVEPLDATPLTRKRRKYEAEVDTEGADELQTVEEKLNTAAPSASGNETPRRRVRHQKTGDAHESYNEGSSLHTNGKLSDQRPRRGTATSPLEMGDRSPVQLTPRKPKTPSKPKTPKSPSSTPSNKRGRQPKRANATPTSHKGEESELGFREIPTEARKSVHGKTKALRSSRDLSQKQHDSRQRSLSLPGQDIRESPEDAEDALNPKIRAEQRRQYRKTIPARLKKQTEPQHAQDKDCDEAHE